MVLFFAFLLLCFAVAVCYDDEIDDDVFAERSAPKKETSDVGSVGGAPRVIGDL